MRINLLTLTETERLAGIMPQRCLLGKRRPEARQTAVPGAVLLDLMMPEMDGFTFVDELRRRPECRNVPIIVVTAKDLIEEDRRRLNGQVLQILEKGGSSTQTLLQEIHRVLDSLAEPPKTL